MSDRKYPQWREIIRDIGVCGDGGLRRLEKQGPEGMVVAALSRMVTAQPSLRAAHPAWSTDARRLGIAVAALGAILILGWLAYHRWSAEDLPPEYVTVPATRRDIAAQVTATGTLSPVVEVQVSSVVSGRIKELFVDYNSEVKAGQVIATIDPQLFETAIDQARGRLMSAQAELARAEAEHANALLEFERLTTLAGSGEVALADADRARADWLAAKAQIQASRAGIAEARASLDQSTVNLAYTTIRSPIDGIVVSRNVDVGQVVAASLQAPTLFVIAEELRNMEVHTSVAESDVGQLRAGIRAEFFVDAYPGETFQGVVKQVRYEAVTVSNVVTYDALIEVRNDDLKLRPGMTANVNLIVDERRNALVIPNRALRYQPTDPGLRGDRAEPGGKERDGRGATVGKPVAGPQSSQGRDRGGHASASQSDAASRLEPSLQAKGDRKRRVWKLRDGKPEPIDIVVGLSDGNDIEVVAGPLEEGDPVIVSEGKEVDRAPSDSPRHGPPRVF